MERSPFVCPLINSFGDPGDICEGETFDLTASGLFSLDSTSNCQTNFGITFLSFSGPTAPLDPYAGGTVLATIPFGDLDDFDISRSGTVTNLGGNLTPGIYNICVILDENPTDITCRPSICFALEVFAIPNGVPTNPVNASYCGRQRPAALRVDTPPTGTIITWWTAPTGGMEVTGATLFPPSANNFITLGPFSNPAPPPPGGDITLYAEVTDPNNGCGSGSRVAVTLTRFADPVVTFTAPDDLCENAGIQTSLGGGLPEGGTYSGPGVMDDGNGMTFTFDPALAGVGMQTITYNFTDANGCSGSASDMVDVLEAPVSPSANNIVVCDGGSTLIVPSEGTSPIVVGMTLFSEFFETDGNGTRYTTSVPEFNDGANDFFTRTDGMGIDTNYALSGQQGSFYFVAQDLDGDGGPAEVVLNFTGINISNFTGLNFEVSLAEDDANDGDEDWDDSPADNNFLHIDYQIDGGGFQNLIHVEGDALGNTNGTPRLDTDFDGVGDGTELTDVFQAFNASIPDTGSVMDIRIRINLEDGDEDIAFDNLMLGGFDANGVMFKYYDADPALGTANLLAGPTTLPYDPATTPTNSPQTVYVTVCAANGCESEATPVVVTVNPLPLLTTIVEDISVCPGDANGSIDLTAMGNAPFIYLWSTTDGAGLIPTDEDQNNLTAGTYSVTVTDDSTCVSTLDVLVLDTVDVEAPVIICSDSIGLTCGDNTFPDSTGTGLAMATDNCSPIITLAYLDSLNLDGCGGLTGTLLRTWQATDIAGNSSTCQQIIHLIDTISPTFMLPADTTIACDDDPDDLTLTGNVTNLMDNCGPSPLMALWINELHYDNTGGDVDEFIEIAGTAGIDLADYQLVAYEGSDGMMEGMPITLSGILPDEGNGYGALAFGPTELSAQYFENGPAEGRALIEAATGLVLQFISYEGAVMAVDGPAAGMTSIDIGLAEGEGTAVGTSLQLTGAGNVAAAFVWSPSAASSPGSLNAGQTIPALTFPIPTATYADVFTPGAICPAAGIITRTWLVTDACGNANAITQTITVIDTIGPVIVCPMDISIECDADDSPANTGTATASDACDANPVITFADVETPGTCPQERIIIRTWTATDACGNSSQCTQIITVEDTTPPVPPSIDLVLNIQCANELPDPIVLTATDNCSPDLMASPIDAFIPGICASRFTLNRTWTFTDECGNSSSITQMINVSDDQPIALTSCAPDQTIGCASGAVPMPHLIQVQTPCNSSFTVEAIGPVVNGTPNCPGTTYTITYIATDDCGRTASCDQVYTIDNEGPDLIVPNEICIIECPEDPAMIINSFNNFAANAVVNTSCTGLDATIFNDFNPDGFTPVDCNNNPFAVSNVRAWQTVTFTAIDPCGRSSAGDILVLVVDNTPPTIVGEPFLTIRECDDLTQSEYDNWIADNLANMTATDFCGEVTWS
ncbi:MAG: hypothetical protein AAF985_04325, partial [Bacteroidota bacterium]